MELSDADICAIVSALDLRVAVDQGLISMFDHVLRDALTRADRHMDMLEQALVGERQEVEAPSRLCSGGPVIEAFRRADAVPMTKAQAGEFTVSWRLVHPGREMERLTSPPPQPLEPAPQEISGLYMPFCYSYAEDAEFNDSEDACLIALVKLSSGEGRNAEELIEDLMKALGRAARTGLMEVVGVAGERARRLAMDLSLASKRDTALLEDLNHIGRLIERLDHVRTRVVEATIADTSEALGPRPGSEHTYVVPVGRSTRWLIGTAVSMLPALHRDRYQEEFSAEVLDQPPGTGQLRCALRQACGAWTLRRMLSTKGIPQ